MNRIARSGVNRQLLICGAVGAMILSVLGWGVLAAQPEAANAELTARIERLIQQLDDDKFDVREKAEAELIKIGSAAVARLTAAAKDSSAERSQRATKALREIRKGDAGLKYLSGVQHEGLLGAVTVDISPDGKFVYVPGFQRSAMNVFERDAITGSLTHRSSLAEPAQLGGVVTVRLSPDGKQAVAAAFGTTSLGLLSRDATSGELKLVASWQGQPEAPLQWPIDATFSTDGQFVYGVDDHRAAVVVLKIADGKRLTHVQSFVEPTGAFAGARGITAHPDGKTLYVSSYQAGALAVLDRDAASGQVRVRQILRDEQDGVHGLSGTMSVCVSRDGKFVYSTSGRFEGDNAVTVFQVGDGGKLKVLQEFINDQSDLTNFTGGNEMCLSPDDTWLYASGTTSCSLACFRRDAQSGKLQFVTTICNEATGAGANLGANGVACSSDGRFLYLALEDAGGISVFERGR